MKIEIKNVRATEICFNNKYYKTKEPIDVTLSEGLRLARLFQGADLTVDRVPYNPEIFKNEKRFVFLSDIDTVSGWGNVSLNLIKNSKEFDVSLIGKLMAVHEPSVLKAATREIDSGMGIVVHEQPKENWFSIPFQRKIAIVPFETTVIPASWIARINTCVALLVPCQQNVEAFKASGVTIPIEVIHWGVDDLNYYEVNRSEDRPFTFGTMGALSTRKGTDILVDAFLKAFPNERDVELRCKTSFNGFHWASRDPRVRVDLTQWSYS